MSETVPHSINPKSAWREVARVGLHKRSTAERLADFLEIYGPYDEETARAQASRCVQCPDPLCVTGCPLGNRISEWLALTAEGKFSEAAAILYSTSSLPEIASRVCPSDRMCESRCILQGKAEPVSIWAIEQFLTEYAFVHGEAQAPVAAPNGWRVAVIGAGPGGLTCADVLSRLGYAVTVFDWRLVPGGILVSGTPGFRLEPSVVKRRVAMLEARGVVFHLGAHVEEDLHFARLHDSFDAVFLGFGARKARDLDLPGRDLRGVSLALSYLLQQDGGGAGGAPAFEVAGRRVVVIGGGDMAVGCLRVALRSGAREAIGVYRREEADMPCIHSEYECAVEEGARFEFLAAPVALVGNDDGAVTAVRCLRTVQGAEDANRRRSVQMQPGTEFEIPADRVFLAVGFDPSPLPAENPFGSMDRTADGALQVDHNQMTSTPGLFAGGDLVRGPSSVLQVVQDARKAAEGIDRYLQAKVKA
jgi:glutamate synthase (NADPH/NADH) small chain